MPAFIHSLTVGGIKFEPLFAPNGERGWGAEVTADGVIFLRNADGYFIVKATFDLDAVSTVEWPSLAFADLDEVAAHLPTLVAWLKRLQAGKAQDD